MFTFAIVFWSLPIMYCVALPHTHSSDLCDCTDGNSPLHTRFHIDWLIRYSIHCWQPMLERCRQSCFVPSLMAEMLAFNRIKLTWLRAKVYLGLLFWDCFFFPAVRFKVFVCFDLLGSVVTSFDILWSEVSNPSTLAATPFNALRKQVVWLGIWHW